MSYKNFAALDDIDVRGKKVFLLIDINSTIVRGKPVMSGRMRAAAKTIGLLKRRGARVIASSYQSRPGKKDFVSLRGHAKLMNTLTKLSFVPEFTGKRAERAIGNLKNGEAILLENRRFEKAEYTAVGPRNKVALFFKNKFDIYINDAFSVSHRDEVSITELPKKKARCIGPTLEKELRGAAKIQERARDSLFVLGGLKFDDTKLLVKHNKVLPTGTLALLVLKAHGYTLGKAEREFLKSQFKHLPFIRKHLHLFEVPIDMAFCIKGVRKEFDVGNFPERYLALDIGSKTISVYEKKIMQSRRILMKGTAGDCSVPGFCKGTLTLLKSVGKSKGFSVVSGGHTSTALERIKTYKSRIDHMSLSGGALVYFLAGKKLPGLAVLQKK